MSAIVELAKRIIFRQRYDSDSYIKHLRKIGITIGEDVTIFVPTKTLIDETLPWMITIGNHVCITEGVKILAHDYSWSVIKGYSGESIPSGAVIGNCRPVKIGDNVFIGMNAVITDGVTIGNNVIIGAGSVVTKDCESDSVYAGVPAKKITDIGSFFRKRKEAQLSEAVEVARSYYRRYGKKPEKEIFHEYFMLFCNVDDVKANDVFNAKIDLCMTREASIKYLNENPPLFGSYEEFLDYCFKDGDPDNGEES